MALAEARRVFLWRLVLVAVSLTLWEASVRGNLINAFWISSPSMILDRAARLWWEGDLWPHVQETLLEMALGLVTGCAVGVPVGVAVGAVPRVRRVLEPYLIVFNAFPKIALAPLYLVWFGISLGLKVAMAFSLVVFVMILGTVAGFASLRQGWVDHAVLLGASRWQLVRVVVVPALLPWIFTSFRLSVGFALMGAVLGEFIATQRGIGYLIDEGVGMFDTATVFVGLLMLLLIALVSNFITEWVGARLRILNVQLRNEQVL
jgi:NitT/TauT family transport system permease protein